jgi:peptide chain release factor 1
MIDIDSKLAAIENRYDEINHLMAEPETLSDPALLERYGREYSSMTEVVQTYRALQSTRAQIKGTEQMLQDSLEDELRDLARTEIMDLRQREEELLKQIQLELVPRDAMDDRNVIVTIQAGAGGDEAGLFAADLFRMYTHYAENKRWAVELINANQSSAGGYREVVFEVRGRGAYARLKFEGGAHRVQRVPATEAQGRLHTSTAKVIVLPEAEEVEV